MVSVAAGLAREGLRPWVYSIAPFVYAQPSSRSAMTSACTGFRSCWWATGAVMATASWARRTMRWKTMGVLLPCPLRAYVPAFDQRCHGSDRAACSTVPTSGVSAAGAFRATQGMGRSALRAVETPAEGEGWLIVVDRDPGRRHLGRRRQTRAAGKADPLGALPSFPPTRFPRSSSPTLPGSRGCSWSRSTSPRAASDR